MAVAAYAAERFAFVQSYVRRLGVTLSRTQPDFDRFMAACLKAELAYLDLFQLREARRVGLDHPHPDTVDGPWRPAAPLSRRTATASSASHTVPAAIVSADNAASFASQPSGKTLKDCRTKWIENRVKARKQVRNDSLRGMDATVALFEAHAGLTDIGAMRRKHVLAFRDHLESTRDYKTATVNKKVGYVSALLRTALKAGWTETALGENIFPEGPEDEGTREPYQEQDLAKIFAHPIFTASHRFTRAKACSELQFWPPLIACLHGRISSEILQLGGVLRRGAGARARPPLIVDDFSSDRILVRVKGPADDGNPGQKWQTLKSLSFSPRKRLIVVRDSRLLDALPGRRMDLT